MSDKQQDHHNWPDVIIKSLEFAWRLIDSGKLLQFVILSVLIVVIIIVSRLPSDQLLPFFKLLGSRILLVIVFAVLEIVTIYLWRKEVRLYRNELQRNVEEKKFWIHQIIKTHHTSKYSWGRELLEKAMQEEMKFGDIESKNEGGKNENSNSI